MSHEEEKQTEDRLIDFLTSGFTSSANMFNGTVVRACAKDRRAFGMLYTYYKKPLGKRLAYLVRDQDVAYELYQEVFLKIWARLPIQPPRNFEAWLYRIARNIALDYLRHMEKVEFSPWPEQETSELSDTLLSSFLSSTGHEEQVCEMLCIQQALTLMSSQYRICVLLQDLWGYSQREIAESLSLHESSVSANITRGHKQLRAAYRKIMDAEAPKKGEQTS